MLGLTMNLRNALRATNAFGKTVRDVRTDRDMSQQEFSDLIHIQRSYLSNVENGESFPTVLVMFSIIEQSGMTPAQFIERVHHRALFELQYPIERQTVVALHHEGLNNAARIRRPVET